MPLLIGAQTLAGVAPAPAVICASAPGECSACDACCFDVSPEACAACVVVLLDCRCGFCGSSSLPG